MPERIVVAMSGGVDSSVAAALLKTQGYELVGISLKLWPKEICDSTPKTKVCCSARDIEDARSVGQRLGIPVYAVDASAEFQHNVIDYFVSSYAAGETPNPCVACNRSIKFGFLWQKALGLGAGKIATGHYARVVWDPARRRYAIEEAADPSKDQSYALFQLTQEQLSRVVMPLGEMSKVAVRDLARQHGLSVAEKPDSQDICFVPASGYREFVRPRAQAGLTPGPIVTREGETLGTHDGVAMYTIGQRRGLGIAAKHPLYVIALDTARNAVVVGPEEQLLRKSFLCKNPTWMAIERLSEPMRVGVKIRYHHSKAAATIEMNGENVRVEFDEPQPAVTPGQAAVFYEGPRIVGGGWILP